MKRQEVIKTFEDQPLGTDINLTTDKWKEMRITIALVMVTMATVFCFASSFVLIWWHEDNAFSETYIRSQSSSMIEMHFRPIYTWCSIPTIRLRGFQQYTLNKHISYTQGVGFKCKIVFQKKREMREMLKIYCLTVSPPAQSSSMIEMHSRPNLHLSSISSPDCMAINNLLHRFITLSLCCQIYNSYLLK